jgi:hypothetical protein
MNTERPNVPQLLQLLNQAYETLILRERPTADEITRLRTVWNDFQWYSERFGATRWSLTPRPGKWSFSDILWHITEQAVEATNENPPEPVRYFIDHGKEHVGQIAELWFLIQEP